MIKGLEESLWKTPISGLAGFPQFLGQLNWETFKLLELEDLRDHLGQLCIFIERRSRERNGLLQLFGFLLR